MEPTGPPARPQRIIRNAAHFHQLEAEARAAALSGANAGYCGDFPENDDDAQGVLIDEMLEAMANTAGVVDNDSSDVKVIRDLPRDKQEIMAWRALFKVRDTQQGLHNPDILTARFPDFTSRWKAVLALVRSSKAGATQFFAVHYLDRYTANPIMELNTKISNNNTNRNKDYNYELKAARDHGQIVTKFDDRAEIRDTSGTLLKTLMKPRKRVLSEFLPPELAQSPAAKVKRSRGSRRGMGASASPVGVSSVANGGQTTENHAASSLHAIQEEEAYEPVHADSSSVPLGDNHSNRQHLNADNFTMNSSQTDEVPTQAFQSNADYPRAELFDDELFSGDQSNTDLSYADLDNAYLDSSEHGRPNYSGDNLTNSLNDTVLNNTGSNSTGLHPSIATLGNAGQHHMPHQTQLPSLERDHSNTNYGGNEAGFRRTAVNRSGRVIQNAAGASWWVEDSSSGE
ncbi:hypothetical protein GE21DRAFT_5280 [Neurospora crassa]|uniref:Uncharacterized protein n=2 Tax=Neurospora crassa TaxID=5141 RepID=Q7SAU7_NEUCR|nr:hypothetical protein NCU07643 [Neurospora crassa OR74A]EAA33515.1 hypothetical protein NCU07643 [Neurospora crassa OR74A]KHE78666.1 hypothetical protein GE21DRAFT_5280 [Neurospora crassa]CAE85477.1 hypothetical protein [Neurospora crassa]|eukprot:XP_962751.1 hypothetical protein NCU07643 [Neurospora crassa OR74A]